MDAQAIESKHVLVEIQDSTMKLTLNRSDKKNAITRGMYSDLVEALQQAEDDPAVKAVVLCGAGSCFTAGNDLVDFVTTETTPSENPLEDAPVLAFLDTYRKFPKPVIVAVQGEAVGIGTTLLQHSDLCFASSNAHFSLPFVKLGLCPEFASSYLLPRLAGHAKAFEWLVLGRPFSAFEAHTFGLINGVVENPIDHAMTVAERISRLPPKAVREAKKLIKAASMKPVDQSIGLEVQQFTRALKGAEFAEAVAAFFEKRESKFDG